MMCWIFGNAVLLEVSDMTSSSRMKFCMMAIYYKFNKLQPAGCNRVSPACSVLCLFSSVVHYMYSDCMNDLLFYDHNKPTSCADARMVRSYINTSAATGVWGDSHKGDDGCLDAVLGQHGLARVKFVPPFHQVPQAGVAPTMVMVVPLAAGEGDHHG